jgi:hypothetical protein
MSDQMLDPGTSAIPGRVCRRSRTVWCARCAGPPAIAADTAWTGTWAAAPQSSGVSFGAQTLRQIVHTSMSGSTARIELSNAFGSGPVTIADVHVANRTSGSSIDPQSDHAVTFGGQASVTIAAGQKAVSDAVPFKPDNGWTQAGEDSREAYGAFVRSSNSGCDGVVDFDTAVHDPANPAQWNPAYDSGDHLHPNTGGLQAMADGVDLGLFD